MPASGRKLDIVLRSATGLKKVSSSRMAAYAVAWMEPSLRFPSPADKLHGRNPEWNTTISITLDERALAVSGQRLHIELLGQGLVSTKPIGFVTVDITELLLLASDGNAVRAPFLDHPVRRRSGRQQGILNFELCLQASTSKQAQAEATHLDEEDEEEFLTMELEKSSSSSQFARRSDSRRGERGYGLAVDEIALLQSSR